MMCISLAEASEELRTDDRHVCAMSTSVPMLKKHYGHTSNVASAAELTKGGRFKSTWKAMAVDWLTEWIKKTPAPERWVVNTACFS
jgi:hypothetical protein